MSEQTSQPDQPPANPPSDQPAPETQVSESTQQDAAKEREKSGGYD